MYGQGADFITTRVPPVDASGNSIPGPDLLSGPIGAGTGVLGRGGVNDPTEMQAASGAGVVGLAGGVALPPANSTDGVGVFGQGTLGVSGTGPVIGVIGNTSTGTGVFGSATAKSGRGGMFASNEAAQLQLFPHSIEVKNPDSKLSTPLELNGGIPQALPKAGFGGDLLAINIVTKVAQDVPGKGPSELTTCTLWLCVRSEDKNTSTPAVWSQILLGGLVSGQI